MRDRRSIRLRAHDYASPGAYFVTICAQKRQPLFGDPALRAIVEQAWREIPSHFKGIALDEFVVMPNHVHGIIIRTDIGAQLGEPNVGAQHAAPLRARVPPGSLGAVIRSFKAAATREYRKVSGRPNFAVWQRSYYERVIRDERELARVQEYIVLNPLRWEFDRENPHRKQDRRHEDEWLWLEGRR